MRRQMLDARHSGDFLEMGIYSLVKIGNDYVLRADGQAILKVANRRRALKLLSDASALFQAHAMQSAPPAPDASSARETPELS